ncbi:unnamed protein product [Schistosoma mattheei]|uniref:Uncharacterized protein n=1 Tax=Schistosoma mattheei TaxID=31246 RepID=A0A183NJZ2_9TREM|nr:unnamed protein product [Schistosoma mattheei]
MAREVNMNDLPMHHPDLSGNEHTNVRIRWPFIKTTTKDVQSEYFAGLRITSSSNLSNSLFTRGREAYGTDRFS